MHADQVDVSAEVVARLVADQFPGWSHARVRPIASGGTVNALFRVGDDVVLRFPLRPSPDPATRESLGREQDCARRLADVVDVEVPRPLGLGRPGEGYQGWWTAYRWIPGRTADEGSVADLAGFAHDLARFVRQVHAMDTEGRGWDGRSRGGPLAGLDDRVREALSDSVDLLDVAPIAATWERCLTADGHTGDDVWIHADLMPGNFLVRGGRLAAVIDLGSLTIGDPAVDLMPAWNLLDIRARAAYRAALGADDAAWERGRGWAIAQAVIALPYYVHTNPHMTAVARTTLRAVLE
jgi:aminoglycoside phosphotransferase (APT) family kinase protein